MVFETNDERLAEEVRKRDDELDQLQRDIRSFLTLMSVSRLSEEMSRRQIGLLYAATDLENIGDVIDKNLMELALKKIHGRHTFSREGWEEISGFHRRVEQAFERSVSAFTTGDLGLADQAIKEKDELSDYERVLRRAHIARLNFGRAESIDTSDIHLDVLSNLKRINTHATNLAYVAKGQL